MHIQRRVFMIFAVLAPVGAHAGAWGPGSFENDDALDWVIDCVRSNGPDLVAGALNQAVSARYLEAPEGSFAVAAAEVVAAARGKPTEKLPIELRSWLRKQPAGGIAKLGPLAIQAMERTGTAQSSELADLWRQSSSYSTWQRGLRDLVKRLR